MTSWEERMSKRAQERVSADAVAAQAKRDMQQREWAIERAAAMSELDAQRIIDSEPIACACLGGPYCCAVTYQAAQRRLGICD